MTPVCACCSTSIIWEGQSEKLRCKCPYCSYLNLQKKNFTQRSATKFMVRVCFHKRLFLIQFKFDLIFIYAPTYNKMKFSHLNKSFSNSEASFFKVTVLSQIEHSNCRMCITHASYGINICMY